jgi:WxL Interacting Protein, peptidoglycan binding domain
VSSARRLPLSTALAALAAAVCVSPALAGQPVFALKPVTFDPLVPATRSYFILDSRPGELIHDSVQVVNTGSETGTAYLYAVDATTGSTSGAVYLDRDRPTTDVGAWISLGAGKITLGPGRRIVVPFTVRVPAQVRGGEHLGGLVAENATVTGSTGRRGGSTLRVRIRHLTIAAVEVKLPGTSVSRMTIRTVKPGGRQGYQYLYVGLANVGNVMLKPTGTIVVTDARGRTVARRPLSLDTFLPRTRIDYPVLLPQRFLRPGSYRARVVLQYGHGPIDSRQAEGGAGRILSTARTLGFTVSDTNARQVYPGTAPFRPPARGLAAVGSGPGLLTLLGWLAAGLAGAGLVFILVVRRGGVRTARVRAEPSRAASPRTKGPGSRRRGGRQVSEELLAWRESFGSRGRDSRDQ